MFEEYLKDSSELFKIAETYSKKSNEIEAKRYYRVAIFCASSAMEAFINYIGDSYKKAESSNKHGIAFLNDKQIIFDPKKGKTIQQTRYYSITDKIKFLIMMFVMDFDFCTNKYWSYYNIFKKLRDSLIHPKLFDDETDLLVYKDVFQKGLTGIIELMDIISKGIFTKGLRQNILDLKPF